MNLQNLLFLTIDVLLPDIKFNIINFHLICTFNTIKLIMSEVHL